MAPTHIILSPGPCTPGEAGICTDVVRAVGDRIPILGVCLGHQCIGEAYGGRVVRAVRPMHGRTAPTYHNESGVLAGLPSPFEATRYHSLIVERETLPQELQVTAQSVDGEIMALQHKRFPVSGVQFHPESVATEWGYRILANFLGMNNTGNLPEHGDLGRSVVSSLRHSREGGNPEKTTLDSRLRGNDGAGRNSAVRGNDT